MTDAEYLQGLVIDMDKVTHRLQAFLSEQKRKRGYSAKYYPRNSFMERLMEAEHLTRLADDVLNQAMDRID